MSLAGKSRSLENFCGLAYTSIKMLNLNPLWTLRQHESNLGKVLHFQCKVKIFLDSPVYEGYI